jgi:hypothetical protein
MRTAELYETLEQLDVGGGTSFKNIKSDLERKPFNAVGRTFVDCLDILYQPIASGNK